MACNPEELALGLEVVSPVIPTDPESGWNGVAAERGFGLDGAAEVLVTERASPVASPARKPDILQSSRAVDGEWEFRSLTLVRECGANMLRLRRVPRDLITAENRRQTDRCPW